MTDAAWKWLLLGFCAIGVAIVAIGAADQFGIAGRPWYGFLDANVSQSDHAYIIAIGSPNAGGASDRAGIKDGDLVDLREIPLDTRVRELFQPLATTHITRIVHRGKQTLALPFIGSTVWEGAAQWKLSTLLPEQFANAWFLGCALLIAFRCFAMREGRVLALVLLFFIITDWVGPANLAIPNAALSLVLYAVAQAAQVVANMLLVSLTMQFGVRAAWRRALEIGAYAINLFSLVGPLLGAYALATLAFDPVPFLLGAFWHYAVDAAAIAVAVVAIVALATTPKHERPRAGWLLLPMSLATAIQAMFANVTGLISDWYLYVGTQAAANLVLLAAAAAVTYALLNRRVLDFGFVVNRAIVIVIVSLTVVLPFVALEWVLASFFPTISRTATLVVSAAVTLALGLLMPMLYAAISEGVERFLFPNEYRARKQVQTLAAGLPYAESFEAIGATLTKAICRAFKLPSAVVYRRNGDGRFIRDSAHGWEEHEQLESIDVQRLAMDVQASHSLVRLADEFLDGEGLPNGDREPAFAFALVARQTLVGYVLYSAHPNGVDLDPSEVRLLHDVAREASRGYDAVELASRVEHAYLARIEAENEAKETLRRSNAALERINEAQARFMPNEFLQLLNKQSIIDVELGDNVQQRMTVLFSDIRSFTTLSEGMAPPEIFAFLNRYLQRAEPIVSEHGGFIDKYIGDAVMGLFPKRADDALGAGLEMLREVRVLNRKFADEGKPTMAIGVGLHTGDLMLGTIGGRNRMETTVIADAVNAASRLESACKTFGCSLVLSRATRDSLSDPDRFMLRNLGAIHVKGKAEVLHVYEAFDADPAELIAHKQRTIARFDEARDAYEKGAHENARLLFQEIARANPHDGPARYYLELLRSN